MEIFGKIFFGFVQSTILLFIFTCVIGDKQFIIKNKLKSILFNVLYISFSYLINIYIPTAITTVILAFFSAFTLKYITKSKICISFVATAIIFVIIKGCDFIAYFIITTIIEEHSLIIKNTTLCLWIICIFCTFIKIAIAISVYKIDFKKSKLTLFNKKNDIFSCFLILQLLILLIFILSLNIIVAHDNNITIYNIVLLILYILLVCVSILDLKEKEKTIRLQHKFECQEKYVKNIETVMDVIRREKHDFINHLNTILALCTLNKPDTLERIQNYIKKLTDNVSTSYSFYETGNDYIDALLAVKSNYAFEHDIKFEVDFEEDLGKICVDDSGLTSIIGNIVDNAFEAVISVEYDKEKIVSIYGYIADNRYYISISDNGPMISAKNLDKIFRKGFSTKGNNKKDHGYGLFIVKKLIEKNFGKIKVFSSEEDTEFLIIFNLKDSL